MDYDVISVKPIAHLRLFVTFKDQTSGEVILSESFLTGVFEQLKDTRIFYQVHCKHAFVEWPNEVDLAPDVMYSKIKQHGRWVVEDEI